MVLDKIKQPNDIKKLSPEELETLSKEIRQFMITSLSKTGGHLASNLCSVELTMALHMVMDLPKDKIVWDVGHQSYTHKILTGRKDGFKTLRSYGGMSGFPKPDESPCDAFGSGHSSTSISAGLGLAWAREIKGESYKVVSVIGDGALTGGMALEALNNASAIKQNFVIILNDNNMSISKNVGGMSTQLAKLRTNTGYTGLKEEVTQSLEKIPVYGDKIVARIRRTKSGIKQLFIPGMLFEEMGIMYMGPVDGHDIEAMIKLFNSAFAFPGPVLVHVITHKGKGYRPAELHPSRFHGTQPFDLATGIPLKKKCPGYTDIFSTVMRKSGDKYPDLVGITAAMEDGTGLHRYHNMFPDRFFDVGIAEEHAVTFAAGLAKAGLTPVFAVYSSFLQRAYDQILHDVALQKLHVIFAVDRAGIVGEDGDTHQGIFDLSYLTTIPNLAVLAPKNKWELADMLKFAFSYDGPIAIRYPKGAASVRYRLHRAPIELGKSEELEAGEGILLYAIGSMVDVAEKVRRELLVYGIHVTVTNARFAAPLDKKYLLDAARKYDLIVTMEENVRSGGFGERVEDLLNEAGFRGRTMIVSLPDAFIPHGGRNLLLAENGLDAVTICDRIRRYVEEQRGRD